MKTELKTGEEILLIARRHWVILLRSFLLALVLDAAAVAVLGWTTWTRGTGATAAVLSLPLFATAYFVYAIVERRSDLWCVTSRRIIDETGVFSLHSKESPLDKINNINYSQSLLGRVLGFGDIQIQTAAETGATVVRYIKNPRGLRDTVTRARENQRQREVTEQALALADAINIKRGSSTAATERPCPYCAETIKAAAVLCRFCGRDVKPG